ncbi:MAG: acyltransferase [Bacteroidia bacterium]|nr:acyltransferase [Bacteroidia bacterium]
MSNGNNPNVYFPSLNGLRFIAAALVFLFHFTTLICVKEFGYNPQTNFISVLGDVGVTLFFVLSGFLITYLLLTEQARTSTINIGKFYIRRILRIWPLYFFVIAIYISYGLLFGQIDAQFFWLKLLLYIFFMPNVAYTLFVAGGLPIQLWSVGSEEQFYFVYPVVVKYAKQHLIKFLIIVPILFIGFRIVLEHRLGTQAPVMFKGINIFLFLLDMVNMFRIDCMAIGGVFAWLLFKQHQLLKIVYTKTTQAILYATLVVLIAVLYKSPILHHTIYALLFGAIILNLSSNKATILNFEYPIFNKLGGISYGIYVFHPLVFTIINEHFKLRGTAITLITCFVISFVITLIISQLSYTYLETPFLKFKHKFSIITSGNNAK